MSSPESTNYVAQGREVGRAGLLASTHHQILGGFLAELYAAESTDDDRRVILTKGAYDELARNRLLDRKCWELQDSGKVDFRVVDDKTLPAGITVDNESVQFAVPELDPLVDQTWFEPADQHASAVSIEALPDLFEQGASPARSFSTGSWAAVAEATAEEFSPAFERDLRAIADHEAAITAGFGTLALVDVLVFVGALHDCLQHDFVELGRRFSIGSQGAYTNAAKRLEDAGVVDREPVSDGTVGRPPKRLQATSEMPEDTASQVQVLVDVCA